MGKLKKGRPKQGSARKQAMVSVLQQVWTYGASTKGDVARSQADEFAEAASRGLLTTVIIPGGEVHGRLWKITGAGLAYLTANVGTLSLEELDYVEAHCAA